MTLTITGRTDRQTDGQTECDAICGPLLGRRAAEKNDQLRLLFGFASESHYENTSFPFLLVLLSGRYVLICNLTPDPD